VEVENPKKYIKKVCEKTQNTFKTTTDLQEYTSCTEQEQQSHLSKNIIKPIKKNIFIEQML